MTTLHNLLVALLAGCAAIALPPTVLMSQASADEVEWRYDYGKARQEAVEKGRPLVLDIGTEGCFYCKKLDQYTFRDPGIIAQLNRTCIPVKIDAQRQPDLAEKLRIQNYPTLVYASPDGRVLGSQEGYLEAAALKEHLDKIVAVTIDPEWMLRNYAEATRARDAGDFPKALSLLKPILEEGKGRPVHVRATQQVREMEQLARERAIAPVKPAEAVKVVEATNSVPSERMVIVPPPVVSVGPALAPPDVSPLPGGAKAVVAMTEISRMLKGALANRKGPQVLVTLASRNDSLGQLRLRQAQDTLLQAKEDYRRQQYLACLDRCEMLIANYPDLPESLEAQQMAGEIKKNPEWTKLACDQLGDRLGVLYLNLAETWLSRGEPQQAIFYLERVIQTAPNSRHADIAQVRLTQLQGQPVNKAPDLKKGNETRGE